MPRKKVSFSIGNFELFAYSIFKNIEISSGQGVVQIEPNSVSSIPWVTRLENKKNFWNSLPRKKVSFSIGNFELFAYSIFKNIEISSGQGVVQIEPNSVSSIPWVTRLENKKNFWNSLPRKKVSFSIGNFELFAYSIFKNIEISSGQGVVQIEPSSVSSIPWVTRL